MPKLFGRTLARAQALQILFQAETCGRQVDDVLNDEYLVTQGPIDDYGAALARGCAAHRVELDRILSQVSHGWTVGRMAQVDRNVLRLALYELYFEDDPDVSEATVIDEAVTLARVFGLEDAYAFVNGVLGRVVRDRAAGVDFLASRASDDIPADELEAADAAAADAEMDDLHGDGEADHGQEA